MATIISPPLFLIPLFFLPSPLFFLPDYSQPGSLDGIDNDDLSSSDSASLHGSGAFFPTADSPLASAAPLHSIVPPHSTAAPPHSASNPPMHASIRVSSTPIQVPPIQVPPIKVPPIHVPSSVSMSTLNATLSRGDECGATDLKTSASYKVSLALFHSFRQSGV